MPSSDKVWRMTIAVASHNSSLESSFSLPATCTATPAETLINALHQVNECTRRRHEWQQSGSISTFWSCKDS